MKIHHLTVEDAIASLQSQPEGLAAKEAARRLVEFGTNTVEKVPSEPLSLRFLKSFMRTCCSAAAVEDPSCASASSAIR